MRGIIIDDEAQSHEVLKDLLQKNHPDVRILAHGFNVEQGLELIRIHEPEVVFLDVEMPDGTGFDLLEKAVDPGFMVVFITAHNKYAVSAIHFGALYYLLKPVEPDKLATALDRVREKKEEQFVHEQLKLAYEAFQLVKNEKLPSRMIVSTLDGMHLIPTEDLIRMEAQANFTEIFYTGAKKRLIASVNIGHYEDQFRPYPVFMRVHRGHLVNLLMVETYVRGDNHLVLKDGANVPVSKENREELIRRLRGGLGFS